MPLRPSSPNIDRVSGYATKIAGVLGLCLATASCNADKADGSSTLNRERITQDKYDECHTIIEGDRADIYCFLKNGGPKLRKVSREQFKYAEAGNGERSGDEVMTLYSNGGHLFNMRRMPWMKEKCPTVVEKGPKNSPTKVYMRFPETEKTDPRIVVFFHGNGGQDMKGKETTNVIKFTKEMQEADDPIMFIAPQDGWGNFYPEGREKDEPGNWRDYNDPDTFANLIDFAEGFMGKRGTDITLASFSGGNIAIMKVLKSIEAAKKENPEMAELYERIQRIAYFDSATGTGSQYVADWMTANSRASVWNCYNRGGRYNQGNAVLLETLISHRVSQRRIHTERMKFGYEGHGVFREYYKKFIARQAD